MRKGSLVSIGIVSAIIVVIIVIASSYIPGDRDLTPAQDGTRDDQVADDDSKATSAGTIRQVMTLRTDLSGSSVVVDRPFFLQLRDSLDPEGDASVTATEVLKIAGASPDDVDVRTYDADSLMTAWSPVDAEDGAAGVLLRSGSERFEIASEATVLIMVIISAPGTYAISVNATDAADGNALAPPVTMEVTVDGPAVPYLFSTPAIDTEYSAGWMRSVSNNSVMPFTIGAQTTDRWKETKAGVTMYNWTVTIINPDGMIAYDDMAPFNQGGGTADPSVLVNTSVDSMWSWGKGLPHHVVWNAQHGVRLEGSEASTPTPYEVGSGGTYAAWMAGAWEPIGSGEMAFHQTGHYIFLLTLTKDGQAVSPPLVLETVVS